MALKRINKQLQKLINQPHQQFEFKVSEDNNYHWQILIYGKKQTPYQNGVFHIKMNLPQVYPFKPPQFKFQAPFYHPRVDSKTGKICLDIFADNWSPALTIKVSILAIINMLNDQFTQSLEWYNLQAFKLYKQDKHKYQQTIKQWTQQYSYAAPCL